MRYVVEPSELHSGTVAVPGDKSVSHRALMLGAIADGETRITGFLPGEDCLATLEALRAMGVEIERPKADEAIVHGRGMHGLSPPRGALDLGNSGTAMRLFAGLLSGQAFPTELTGDESLSQRPMGRVIKPLSMMGAGCPWQARRLNRPYCSQDSMPTAKRRSSSLRRPGTIPSACSKPWVLKSGREKRR